MRLLRKKSETELRLKTIKFNTIRMPASCVVSLKRGIPKESESLAASLAVNLWRVRGREKCSQPGFNGRWPRCSQPMDLSEFQKHLKTHEDTLGSHCFLTGYIIG